MESTCAAQAAAGLENEKLTEQTRAQPGPANPGTREPKVNAYRSEPGTLGQLAWTFQQTE